RPDSRVGNSKFTIFPVENSIRIIKSLSIYDRWGNLIFITKDIEPANVEQGWNGKLNGHDVLSGVYVWKADIEYKDDTTEIAAGDITVLR
ncbi:MAG TPA: gliding motility-associated C-terminal domain-containing protein, partial [Saprospiraceae bacterium]|nr:gliding motility-associated C-terminal domain-containing protein [Saprospiraceae bacterium]